jgi:N-acetylglucosamine-6-phosphate deacetylase
MASIHHRAPGPVPAILETKPVMAQVIPDCVHVHPSILRMIWPLLGPDRFISITDGMRALGLGDGTYKYNGLEFESRDGTARYHDGTLIGTAVGLNVLVKRLADTTGCTLDEALRTATRTPARSIGIDAAKGEIALRKDADIVIFNDDLSVWKTIVNGIVVYPPAKHSYTGSERNKK